MRRIRKWLLTGLAITLPTVITAWVLYKIFINLDRLLQQTKYLPAYPEARL